MPTLTLRLTALRLTAATSPGAPRLPPSTTLALSTTTNALSTQTPATTATTPTEHTLPAYTLTWTESLPDHLALRSASLHLVVHAPRRQRAHSCLPFPRAARPRTAELGAVRFDLLHLTCGTVCRSAALTRPDGRGGRAPTSFTISFDIVVEQSAHLSIMLSDARVLRTPAVLSDARELAEAQHAVLSIRASSAPAPPVQTRASRRTAGDALFVFADPPLLPLSARSLPALVASSLTLQLSHATGALHAQLPLHAVWGAIARPATPVRVNLPLTPSHALRFTLHVTGGAPLGQLVGGVTTDAGLVGARPVIFGTRLPDMRRHASQPGLPAGWLSLLDTFGYRYYHHVPSGVNVWTAPVERAAAPAVRKDELSALQCGYTRGKHDIYRRADGVETWIHPAASRVPEPSYGDLGAIMSQPSPVETAAGRDIEPEAAIEVQPQQQPTLKPTPEPEPVPELETKPKLEAEPESELSPPTSLSTIDFPELHPAAFTRPRDATPPFGTASSSARTSHERSRGDVVEMRWTHLDHLFGKTGLGTEGHTLTTVSAGTAMLKFGGAEGSGGKRMNSLHRLDLATSQWSAISPSGVAPLPRTGHSAVAVGADQSRLLIFGGSSPQGRRNDLHMFHVEDQTWSPVVCTGTPPEARARMGMAVTTDGSTAIVFGGRSIYRYLGGKYFDPLHLHAFHAERSEWLQMTPRGPGQRPAPRSGCVLEFINHRQLFVYGGYDDGDRFFDDAFLFDLPSCTWQKVPYPDEPTRPSAREGHCSALMSDQVVIFGGDSPVGLLSDLHQFDTNRLRWGVSPSMVGKGPGKVVDSAMAVGNDGRAVLVGGDTGFNMSRATYTIEVSQRSVVDAKMMKEMAIERGPDASSCVVCLDAKVDAMFLWCGHTVCCRPCSRRVKGVCPVCRQAFSDVVYGLGV